MRVEQEETPGLPAEYTIPNGCVGCGGDLPVRVSRTGAVAVCRVCGLFSRPTLTITHQGLEVTFQVSAQA